MTTSATMTTMVMTITVRTVFFMRKLSKCHLGQTLARNLSSGPSKPIAWMSLCLVLGRVELQVDPPAQFSTPAMRSTLAVVCPTAKYPPSAAA